MVLLALFVLVGLLGDCFGANILAVVPMPSRSHGILMERLLRELGTRGHHITYIAATPPSSPIPNMNVIYVPGIRDEIMKSFPGMGNSSNLLTVRKPNPWLSLLFGFKMSESMCQYILDFSAVKALISSNEKFDLILGEIMLDESILAGFSHKFNAPIVAFATTMPSHYANYLVGNPAPASFIPDVFIGYNDRMSFFERLHNILYGLAIQLNHGLRYLPQHDAIMRFHFGHHLPYVGDILKKTSLVLVNHHYSLSFPRPYAPNMVEIAGVHINTPKPLPEDLKSYMDKAEHGVILFSLGSNVNSSDLPPEKISTILKGLALLPQNVLWKFESELADLPNNVKIMKWLPQSDILAHPNLKAFITHGGLLSTTEAMSFGVPVVGIPLGGDQHINMKQVQDAGWGQTLQFHDLNQDVLYKAANEVIRNPRYREAAQAKAKLLKDNPVDPLESSVWWIEYVLRHKGAPHLRSAAQDLVWYELYLLDVYALAALLLFSIAAVNLSIIKWILKKLGICKTSSKSNSVATQKKNN